MTKPCFLALAITVLFCGCASFHGERTNGILDVTYHVPADLAGRQISTYFNGECLARGTGTSARFFLRPRHFMVRVEMDGAKPFEQALDVPGNGSHQVLDVTLVKQ